MNVDARVSNAFETKICFCLPYVIVSCHDALL